MSRLSRGEDKPQETPVPVPGLLGTMAGGAAVCVLLLSLHDDADKVFFRIANTG